MNTLQDYQKLVDTFFAEEKFLAEPTSLYAPIDYTLRLGGKRLRPTLLVAANALFGGDAAQVRNAALAIEIFHNFTLLHDDMMDRSPLRRGHPTVYRRWGANCAVLSGDTMFALAWRYFLRTPAPRLHEILQCFNENAIEVCEGQQNDMDFEQRDDVTLAEYMEMIRKKTAVLIAAALKIGALYADAPDAEAARLYDFGIHLGLAFQLQDDLLDTFGDTAVFGKKTGQDIRDNKKNFLYLSALQQSTPSQAAELRQLFASDGSLRDEEEKVARVLTIYNSLNLHECTEQAVAREFAQCHSTLDTISAPDDAKQALMQALDALGHRKK